MTNPFASVDFNGPEHQACLISQKKVSRICFYSFFFRHYSEVHYEIDYFENYTAVCMQAYVSDAMTWRLEFCRRVSTI